MIDKSTTMAIILHGLLALVGGLTKSVMQMEKRGFRAVTFIADLVVGAFAGVLTGFICMQFAVPDYLSWFLVSVAGILGESLISVFKKAAKDKINKLVKEVKL